MLWEPIHTLESGIDVCPEINVAPLPLKNFHIRILIHFYIAVIFIFIFFKMFQKWIKVHLCLFWTLEYEIWASFAWLSSLEILNFLCFFYNYFEARQAKKITVSAIMLHYLLKMMTGMDGTQFVWLPWSHGERFCVYTSGINLRLLDPAIPWTTIVWRSSTSTNACVKSLYFDCYISFSSPKQPFGVLLATNNVTSR